MAHQSSNGSSSSLYLRTLHSRKYQLPTTAPQSKERRVQCKERSQWTESEGNFNDVESQSMQKYTECEQLAENLALQEAKTKEEQKKKMASMRLAYKDLSMQERKQNEKLKHKYT